MVIDNFMLYFSDYENPIQSRAHLAIALCGSYIGEILNRYWTLMSVLLLWAFAMPLANSYQSVYTPTKKSAKICENLRAKKTLNSPADFADHTDKAFL
jgi:hypothetical protein